MTAADRPKLLMTNPLLRFIDPALEDRYELVRLWEQPEGTALPGVRAAVIVGQEAPEAFLDRVPDIELIACFTTGYDAVDADALRARGIEASHAPGITAEPVSEFALALILADYRNIVIGDRLAKAGRWHGDGGAIIGRSLKGARLGIVGLGDIGVSLARKGEALGMDIAWWGPRDKPDAPWPYAGTLLDLARDSDVLAICCRADDSNRGMISGEIIDALGPKGLLVNVARGQIVEEDALIDALRAGRLGRAALDVFRDEPATAERWADVPNLIMTPHMAGAVDSGIGTMSAMLRANLDAFFAGDPVPNPIPARCAV